MIRSVGAAPPPIRAEHLSYLAPRYVWSRVSISFAGNDQLSAHLLEILRPRKHSKYWRVLEEVGRLFTWEHTQEMVFSVTDLRVQDTSLTCKMTWVGSDCPIVP